MEKFLIRRLHRFRRSPKLSTPNPIPGIQRSTLNWRQALVICEWHFILRTCANRDSALRGARERSPRVIRKSGRKSCKGSGVKGHGESFDSKDARVGILFQPSHGGGKLIQKFISQARHFLFIPSSCLSQIPFRLRSTEHEPVHARLRKRASTSRHGAPGVGFAS